MSRNFNAGSRDMARAGQMIMNQQAAAGACSFGTASTVGERWGQFSKFAREEGVKYMEQVTTDIVASYGEALQDKVATGKISISTAQNCISAVNTVMSVGSRGNWQRVSPTRDCGISSRCGIASKSKAIDQIEHDTLKSGVSERIGVLMDLERLLGLRFEESALLNARQALNQASTTGRIDITAGTKGGRERTVSVSSAAEVALVRAAEIQGRDKSMIPTGQSYAQFQSLAYRELAAAGGKGFHGERHAFAQSRYFELTGAPSPVEAGWPRTERIKALASYLGISEIDAKVIDESARLGIAEELGHSRQEITNAYLG